MRKIEKAMVQAINERRTWHGSNTSVSSIDDVNCAVYLHGNHIADVNSRTGFVMVNTHTLRQWPTATTKSRLRALGADVRTKNHVIMIDGVAI